MNISDFEILLDKTTQKLNDDVQNNKIIHESRAFESHVLKVMVSVAQADNINISPTFHPHAFPDIKANGFGVEVKSTRQDNWRSVGNSVLEGMRDDDVKTIYVMFGKMGGLPSVRWGRYEEMIKHVRITHAPRFEIDMESERPSLFEVIKIPYKDFAPQTAVEKMRHVREYARGRLQEGERLWWLDDEHSVDLQVRRFSNLLPDEKKIMRAEAAILCPQICAPSRTLNKYDAPLHFLITYRGVLGARDMFSAGSVGMKDGKRGGDHVKRGLLDIEAEMRAATEYLDLPLFAEYWPDGLHIPREKTDRLRQWLKLADKAAAGRWAPSKTLFINPG